MVVGGRGANVERPEGCQTVIDKFVREARFAKVPEQARDRHAPSTLPSDIAQKLRASVELLKGM